MKFIYCIGLLFIVSSSVAQVDVIKVVKQENNAILFASVLDQIVTAKTTRGELTEFGRLYVNDSIVVSSYWITCYSGGAQHQRLETGDAFSSQTLWDINHINKGGKIYFTNIIGHSLYTRNPYKIYNIEIIITD